MGEHTTWIHLIPAYWNMQQWASHYLERHWQLEVVGLGRTHFTMIHVAIGLLLVLLLTLMGLSYKRRVAASREDRLVPESRFGVRNLFELIIDATLSIGEGVMGREKAERFLPLLGTLVFFILFNNLIGLVPGMVPGTDTLKTNFGIALLVFFITHIVGFKDAGLGYAKHFLDLQGLGIRELTTDGDALQILAGPTMDLDGPIALYRWQGAFESQQQTVVTGDQLELVAHLPVGRGDDHPEGICWLPGGGRRLMVVYDSPAKHRLHGGTAIDADLFRLERKRPGRKNRRA